jgi:hypothetical protein
MVREEVDVQNKWLEHIWLQVLFRKVRTEKPPETETGNNAICVRFTNLTCTRLLLGSLSSRHAHEVIDIFGHQGDACGKSMSQVARVLTLLSPK